MDFEQWYTPDLYFYRDHHQNEVDLLLKHADAYIPIEIKSAQNFHPEFLKGLEYLYQFQPKKFLRGI